MTTTNGTDEVLTQLRRHFDHKEFREGQEQIVAAVLRGSDVLAVMPTGSGKSLGYQLPAVMPPGTTLVVSPLISLMKDQMDELNRRGIPSRDEAHCASEWGHDVRPDYRTSARPPPCAGGLVAGFDRPNIHLRVERVEDDEKDDLLPGLVRGRRALVYAATRKTRRTSGNGDAAVGLQRRRHAADRAAHGLKSGTTSITARVRGT